NALVLRSLALGSYSQAQAQSFISTVTGYQSAIQDFNEVAPANLSAAFSDDVKGSDVQQANLLETDVASTPIGGKINLSSTDWYYAMTGRTTKLRSVEQLSDANAESVANSQFETLQYQVAAESAVILIAVVLALLFALLIARRMALSLRSLREGALRVAYEGLPQAVGQIKESDVVGDLSPDDI